MTTSDRDLLRAHAREGSETAFAELVHRHFDLVYSPRVGRGPVLPYFNRPLDPAHVALILRFEHERGTQ